MPPFITAWLARRGLTTLFKVAPYVAAALAVFIAWQWLDYVLDDRRGKAAIIAAMTEERDIFLDREAAALAKVERFVAKAKAADERAATNAALVAELRNAAPNIEVRYVNAPTPDCPARQLVDDGVRKLVTDTNAAQTASYRRVEVSAESRTDDPG